MNRLNKTKSVIFISLISSLIPKDLHSEFISFMCFGMVKLTIKLKNQMLTTSLQITTNTGQEKKLSETAAQICINCMRTK